ncbi:type II secretion system protein N [Desulfogranum mediterraneum]|uniref:type II secretion system protein N n=1 Tax=Desulfogranum mediterraneum TaxID=160661 RepID=UPI0004201B1A|nr:type II secretion system protein N [Desulfogranum mediterraneum]
MVKTLVKMTVIALLSALAVFLWYDRLEQQLMALLPASGKVTVTPGQAPSQEAAPLPALESPPDHGVIVRRNIFQAVLEAEPVTKTTEPDAADLEETRLKLVLLGTVAGDENDARAIIIDQKEKRQDIFRIGDALQGATIQRIIRGKVILQVNGKTEVLTIKDREGGGAPSRAAAASNGGRTPRLAAPVKRATVIRPRRRINFRQPRPALVESVEEPQEPLESDPEAEQAKEQQDAPAAVETEESY